MMTLVRKFLARVDRRIADQLMADAAGHNFSLTEAGATMVALANRLYLIADVLDPREPEKHNA